MFRRFPVGGNRWVPPHYWCIAPRPDLSALHPAQSRHVICNHSLAMSDWDVNDTLVEGGQPPETITQVMQEWSDSTPLPVPKRLDLAYQLAIDLVEVSAAGQARSLLAEAIDLVLEEKEEISRTTASAVVLLYRDLTAICSQTRFFNGVESLLLGCKE